MKNINFKAVIWAIHHYDINANSLLKLSQKLSEEEYIELDLEKTGFNLKFLRTVYQVTASELAKELNLSCSTISKMEKGLSTPSFSTIHVYCQKFNLKFEDILVFSGDNTEKTDASYNLMKKYLKLQGIEEL